MSTSGTYTFSPAEGTLYLNAFSRIGIRRTELTPQHLEDAKIESNLLQAAFSGDGITLWTVDTQTVSLAPGTSTYSVPQNTVQILEVVIQTTSYNRLIFPFSRTDYLSLSNPNMQGFPTSWWWDRAPANATTSIVLWPTPDSSQTYTMEYTRYRQIQDVVPANGGTLELPYLWLDAFTAGLAYRLSRIYAPQLEDRRKADATEAYGIASKVYAEQVPIFVTPGLSTYYRLN